SSMVQGRMVAAAVAGRWAVLLSTDVQLPMVALATAAALSRIAMAVALMAAARVLRRMRCLSYGTKVVCGLPEPARSPGGEVRTRPDRAELRDRSVRPNPDPRRTGRH